MSNRRCLAVTLAVAWGCTKLPPARDPGAEAATPIAIRDGRGQASGRIDEPSGKPRDWIRIARPADHTRLVVSLRPHPISPGADLWVTFFDPQVRSLSPTIDRAGTASDALATFEFDPAPPVVLARIDGKGHDVGTYELAVAFLPARPPSVGSPDAAVAIAPPPRHDGACDWNHPDRENPRCDPSLAPPMPCTDPPDPRFPRCIARPTPTLVRAEPLVLTIDRVVQGDRDTTITIVDRTKVVTTAWHGLILAGATDKPLVGGDVRIVKVEADRIEGRARLTAAQLAPHRRVRLVPPD